MLQEIITAIIVGIAIVIAGSKVFKRFRKKKQPKIQFDKASLAEAHNCSDCAAVCTLRDLPKRTINKSQEVCDTNYVKNEDK